MGFILDVIGPLFTLIGCGYFLGRRRQIDTAGLADVAIYICLPFLLFSTLVRHPITGLAAAQVFAWQAGMYILSLPTIWLVARALDWDKATRSAVTLSLPTVNVASYGVPVVLFALGDEALAIIMLLFVYGNVFASSLGVYIAAGGSNSPGQAIKSVFKLPLIYTAALALTLNALAVPIPASILDTANLIGKAGPILAIILLGIQVSRIQLTESSTTALYGGIGAKILLGPIMGIGLTWCMGAEGPVRNVLLIASCLPTAINALILTVRFDTRPDLLGGILIGSTLWSPLGLAAVLYWIGTN
ncbi:MAG: AEC family transporter [Candidatus Latescibacterota bacterium]|jgi:predicted permease